ncbi:hypothetical protein LOTGIDRAFT_159592 [Lottia gigantea]|uniref:Uncharacterized protein n=1 Tax=Lottia gigantea TaxID=225164 RepID=V4AQ04_LOTGI|nr:hypothetical protein LOTGIDRAFT_159592 [Lottia gigantea]ESO96845.1 hypothetical protein LOTGIDRAFT_159592 [Lottia gigantea]
MTTDMEKVRPITSPIKYTPRTPRNSMQLQAVIRIPLSHPRTKSAFPLRRSTFVSNSKLLLTRSNTTVSDSGRRQNKVVLTSNRHKTATPIRPYQKQQEWWKMMHVDVVPPVLTVQTILPEITTQPTSSKPQQKQNSFHKKVYFEDTTNKMFVDRSKILYFKNCGSKLAESTESMKFAEESNYANDQLYLTINDKRFVQTSKRSVLHPRDSFYLRTPIIEKYGQRDTGATLSCECRLCSLEKEMRLMEKSERDDDIVNSIHIHLTQNLNKPWSEESSLCPPSRPNSPELEVHLKP